MADSPRDVVGVVQSAARKAAESYKQMMRNSPGEVVSRPLNPEARKLTPVERRLWTVRMLENPDLIASARDEMAAGKQVPPDRTVPRALWEALVRGVKELDDGS